MTGKPLSYREAQRYVAEHGGFKINFTQINNMATGLTVSTETAVMFAKAFGQDVELFRGLAAGVPYDRIVREKQAREEYLADPLASIGPTVNLGALMSIPLHPGYVSAGSLLTEAVDEVEPLGEIIPASVRAIRVRGDCMEPIYRDGNVILVQEHTEAQPGQAVVALVDMQNLVVKEFQRTDKGIAYLVPRNGEGTIPAHRFQVVGVVAGVLDLDPLTRSKAA